MSCPDRYTIGYLWTTRRACSGSNTVCKGYQQRTEVVAIKERVKADCSAILDCHHNLRLPSSISFSLDVYFFFVYLHFRSNPLMDL